LSLVADVEARGLSLRKLLLAHHASHYRAGRMTLALVAAEPLDTLEAWVRELFGRVPSGGVPRPEFLAHGSMIAGSTGVLFRLPAVKEAHDLVFTFALPPLHRDYDAKPDEYASHLLGHEGAGSLLSALKARSWASALCAGVSEGGHERSSAAWLFSVGVTLTEAGLAAWRDVAALVFQYIRLLRDAGPQRFVFDELRAVKEQEFRFAEEEDGAEYVSRLAASAERYRPEHAVAGEYLLTRFDPAGVMGVLAALTPHNCRIDLQSSSFAKAAPETLAAPVDGEPGAAAAREPWMDVPFGRAPLPRALLDAWAAAAPAADLALPPRNAFLATDFALRGTGVAGAPADDDDAAFPLVDGTALRAPAPPLRLLGSAINANTSSRFRVWHKLDGLGGRFGAPRAAAFWAVTPSSLAAGGPLSEPLTHLVLKLAEDALAETTYLADVAGLRCHTTPEGARFELKVDGFSHKLPVLCAELFASLTKLPQLVSSDEARLARVREALLRRLRNALVKPAKHAGYLRLLALRQRATPVEAQLAALQAADSSALAAHAASVLSCCSIDALVMGNLTAEEASALAHAAAVALPAGQPVTPDAWPHEAVLRVPPGGAVLFAVAKNAADDNSVSESYFQVGTFAETQPDVRARAMADLLAQCIGEPCFDTLRTKEQLGYTVSSGVRLTHGVLGFAVSVQSAKHGPVRCPVSAACFALLTDCFRRRTWTRASTPFSPRSAPHFAPCRLTSSSATVRPSSARSCRRSARSSRRLTGTGTPSGTATMSSRCASARLRRLRHCSATSCAPGTRRTWRRARRAASCACASRRPAALPRSAPLRRRMLKRTPRCLSRRRLAPKRCGVRGASSPPRRRWSQQPERVTVASRDPSGQRKQAESMVHQI
jgi:nardilysin